MRRFALTICLLLTGCGSSEIDDLREENAELQQKLANIQEKSENLETASENLQQQLQRFDNENWRDVMPDAKEAGGAVEEAQDELSDATDQ
jgi:FtsZ-binding cell division protein ZapB